VSKKAFYRQKTRFFAERAHLDAQSLHKVAQKVRATEEWPILNGGGWKLAQPSVAAVGRPPQMKQERGRIEAGAAVNPRRLDKKGRTRRPGRNAQAQRSFRRTG